MQIVFILLSASLGIYSESSSTGQFPENIAWPFSYDLHLKIGAKASSSYSGHVNIEVKIFKDTNIIMLNASSKMGLTVLKDAVKVIYKPTSLLSRACGWLKGKTEEHYQQTVFSLAFDEENEFLKITMKEPLEINQHYILKIPFSGKIVDSVNGLIKLKHYSHDRWNNDGWEVDIYEELTLVPTNQISFVVADPAFIGDPFKSTKGNSLRLWCKLTSEICEEGLKLLDEGYTFLKQNSKRFGIEYHLKNKLDYIVLSGETDVNVEKLGLIMKSENYFKKGFAFGYEAFKYLMFESVAKQVFGMSLSTNHWDYEWLITCIAKYVSITSLSEVEYNEDSEVKNYMFYLMFTHSEKLSMMKWDSMAGSTSIVAQSEDSPKKLGKGLLILFMLMGALGEENFDRAVNGFVTRYTPSKNVFEQFCYEVDKQSFYRPVNYKNPNILLKPESVTTAEIMEKWIYQEGYPMISVRRFGDDVTITQKRFFWRKKDGDLDNSQCWWVPLTYVTPVYDGDKKIMTAAKEVPKPAEWLKCEKPLAIKVDRKHWIVFKSRLSVPALFRVLYDKENWLLIIEVLENKQEYKKIPAVSRAQLVSDVLAFAYQAHSKPKTDGELDVDFEITFRLVSYLRHEESRLKLMIWMSFFEGYERFKLALKGSAVVRGILKEFLQYILENTYDTIFPYETSLTMLIDEYNNANELFPAKLRIYQESCDSGVKLCQIHSKRIFEAWKSKKFRLKSAVSTYSKQLRLSVMCAAVKATRDKSDVLFIIDALKGTKDQSIDRELLVEALKCPEDFNIIEEVLKYCTTPTSDEVIEEKIAIFKGLLRENDALVQTGTYLFQNYDKINSFFSTWAKEKGHDPVKDFVKIMACEMSPSQLNELSKSGQTNANIRKQLQEFGQCEDFERDHEWVENNERKLENALRILLKK